MSRLLTFTWSRSIEAPVGFKTDDPAWLDIAMRMAWLETQPNDGELTDDQTEEVRAEIAAMENLQRDNFWGGHEKWTRADWEHEFGEHNTNLGYWTWVRHQIEGE